LKPAFGLTFADLYRRDGLVRLDRVFIEALEPFLKPGHRAIGSINSPMQCMLKEVCGQCLQPHEDPLTGKVSLVWKGFLGLERFPWPSPASSRTSRSITSILLRCIKDLARIRCRKRRPPPG